MQSLELLHIEISISRPYHFTNRISHDLSRLRSRFTGVGITELSEQEWHLFTFAPPAANLITIYVEWQHSYWRHLLVIHSAMEFTCRRLFNWFVSDINESLSCTLHHLTHRLCAKLQLSTFHDTYLCTFKQSDHTDSNTTNPS